MNRCSDRKKTDLNNYGNHRGNLLWNGRKTGKTISLCQTSWKSMSNAFLTARMSSRDLRCLGCLETRRKPCSVIFYCVTREYVISQNSLPTFCTSSYELIFKLKPPWEDVAILVFNGVSIGDHTSVRRTYYRRKSYKNIYLWPLMAVNVYYIVWAILR